MENHIADPLPLADLAQIAGVSARHLNRQFSAGLGRSGGAFYRDLRLEKSRELLRQTDLPVLEIAIATGFSGAAHFATAYRKRFGETPSPPSPRSAAQGIDCSPLDKTISDQFESNRGQNY